MCRARESASSRKPSGLCRPGRRSRHKRGASGATGAAGGVSLALCNRRRNSLCPFLAAAATRCPLHVDEAAPVALSFPFSRPVASGFARSGGRPGSDGRWEDRGRGGGLGLVLGCSRSI